MGDGAPRTLRAGSRPLQTVRGMRLSRKPLLVVLAIALLAALGIGWRMFFVSDAEDAFAPDQSAGTVELGSLDGSWTITSGEAGYRIDEVLFGRDVTVTGRTTAVTGTLAADGLTLIGEVVVDLTGVTTDSGKRDAQFRGRIMEVERYPETRLFFDGAVENLGGGRYRTAAGLTVKDATKEVIVEFTVTRDDSGIEVTGSVPLRVSEWPIDPPSIPGIDVEDEMLLEFQATLTGGQDRG